MTIQTRYVPWLIPCRHLKTFMCSTTITCKIRTYLTQNNYFLNTNIKFFCKAMKIYIDFLQKHRCSQSCDHRLCVKRYKSEISAPTLRFQQGARTYVPFREKHHTTCGVLALFDSHFFLDPSRENPSSSPQRPESGSMQWKRLIVTDVNR